MMQFSARYRLLPCSRRPSCRHGPTVLFQQISSSKQFFACSAFRDRKGCRFYQLKQDFDRTAGGAIPLMRSQTGASNSRLRKVLQLKPKDRRYCRECALLFLPDDENRHRRHEVLKRVPHAWLLRPISCLLSSKSADKHEAQYSFAAVSKSVILSQLKERGLKRVICLGAPTVHEAIQLQDVSATDSVLLDIDHRIAQFYPRSKFVHFNMFNHFFLDDGRGEESLDRFIEKSEAHEIAIVCDPPFGGFVQLLAETLAFLFQKIAVVHPQLEVPVILCLPFFLSSFVAKTLPSLKMSEYRVRYANHPKFKSSSTPVRIFTNIPLSEFALPVEEGYTFCPKCRKSVPSDTVHCEKCDSCTSFGSKPGVHCASCKRCVKSSLKHCKRCRKCMPVQHQH